MNFWCKAKLNGMRINIMFVIPHYQYGNDNKFLLDYIISHIISHIIRSYYLYDHIISHEHSKQTFVFLLAYTNLQIE